MEACICAAAAASSWRIAPLARSFFSKVAAMTRTLPPLLKRTLLLRPTFAALATACGIAILFFSGPTAPPVAAEQPAAVKERLSPEGIDGALVICGGGKLPDAVLDRFLQLAGGAKAHLVIIPTASDSADKEPADKILAPWQERKPASA